MRAIATSALAVWFAMGAVASAQEKAGGPPSVAAPAPGLVPDPAYWPARGDRAHALMIRAGGKGALPSFACRSRLAYEDYWRGLEIDDPGVMAELRDSGRAVDLGLVNEVLVLEIETFSQGDPRPRAAVVRVVSGLHRGEKLWVPAFELVQWISKAEIEARAGLAAGPAEILEGARRAVAATSLKEGKGLEAQGRTGLAIGTYEMIVSLHAGTPEAAEAAARLKAIVPASKAARALAIARNLDRSKKTAAAIAAYRDLAKLHPSTPEATEAAARLKALSAPVGQP